jgi:hypothetical protein
LCARDVEQADSRSERHEIRHLARGDPGGHFDDAHASGGRDQLREGDPVAQAECAHRCERDVSSLAG